MIKWVPLLPYLLYPLFFAVTDVITSFSKLNSDGNNIFIDLTFITLCACVIEFKIMQKSKSNCQTSLPVPWKLMRCFIGNKLHFKRVDYFDVGTLYCLNEKATRGDIFLIQLFTRSTICLVPEVILTICVWMSFGLQSTSKVHKSNANYTK